MLFWWLFPHFFAVNSAVAAQTIEQQVTQHIQQEIETWRKQKQLNEITIQLKLRLSTLSKKQESCQTPATITNVSGNLLGFQHWRVSCSLTHPEKHQLMSQVRSQLTIFARLPVVNRTLTRGDIVQMSDIEWRSIKYPSSGSTVLTRPKHMIGQRVTRKIRRHKAIYRTQLASSVWVNIGDQVIIEAESQGFYASVKGEALQSGGEGEKIKVKNLSSGQVVIAYPIAKGRVKTRF